MITRREFFKTAAGGATGLALGSLLPGRLCAGDPSSSTGGQARPNILLIYTDDLGYGDLGCLNPGSKIPTPHLDRLAGEGLCCTDAHCSAGICTPSRYAILTGRYHWRTGMKGVIWPFQDGRFAWPELTLPEMLRRQGYRTGAIGKWHLGWDWEAIRLKPKSKPEVTANFDWAQPIPGGPTTRGFDSFFGVDLPNFPPYAFIENDRVSQVPTEPFVPMPKPEEPGGTGFPGPMVKDWRLDEVLPRTTARAVDWIGQQREAKQPFFLYFAMTSPHCPIVPSPEFKGKSGAGPYGDFVVQTDHCVGQVLQALEDHGLADNTLVIFSSDNGPEALAYPRVAKTGHRSMGPLRGVKRDVWEGGHRVPCLMRWPGVIEPGRRSDALFSQIDLMATIAAVLGVKLPDDTAEDSFDQLPLLRGDAGSETIRPFHIHHTKSTFAVRRGDWVRVEYTSTVNRPEKDFWKAEGWEVPPKVSLYNLREDLAQRQDRSAEQPEIVAELEQLLKQAQSHGSTAPRLASKPASGKKRQGKK